MFEVTNSNTGLIALQGRYEFVGPAMLVLVFFLISSLI